MARNERIRICVFGAGAVGGYLAARLLETRRHEIAVVARGEHLRAIQAHGLTLESAEGRVNLCPDRLTDDARELPSQDLVFVTLKAHSQPAAASAIASLLGERATAVFANNGVPWWWHYRGDLASAQSLPLLDPDASLWSAVGPHRVIGCVVYSANEVTRPGVVRHAANNRWLIGEPDGSRSDRLLGIARVMRDAGLSAEPVTDIRTRIWTKLLRNAPLNSLCALTRLGVDELQEHPPLQRLHDSIVDEVSAIAAAEGVDLSDQLAFAKQSLQLGAAIDGSRPGTIRPSMLQDVLGNRLMEIEAILGQVQAFATASRTPCPVLDTLVALTRGLDQSMGKDDPTQPPTHPR